MYDNINERMLIKGLKVHTLVNYIRENTEEGMRTEVEKSILDMVCPDDSYIPLSEEDLLKALQIEGEFLVLKMKYEEYEEELQEKRLLYKISQALSVVVSYESDGTNYAMIEEFVKYIDSIVDEKQNSIFGVKRVDILSEYPITILFSGILPINQLKMTMGKGLYRVLYEEGNDFEQIFHEYRELISKDIGIPLLPLLPRVDDTLDDFTVRMEDVMNKRIISEFEVREDVDNETIVAYLQKILYIYRKLAHKI